MDVIKLRVATIVSKMIRWAMVNESSKDEGPYPGQEVTYHGQEGDSQVWFPYGFHALAPRGTLSLVFAVGGDTGALVHIPGSPRERIKLSQGEVVVFNPLTKAHVVFREDGDIHIDSPDQVSITAPNGLTINANVQINGTLDVSGDIEVTGNADFLSTSDFVGQSEFHEAVLVDNTADSNGVFDVREHRHKRGGIETTGPGDTGQVI